MDVDARQQPHYRKVFSHNLRHPLLLKIGKQQADGRHEIISSLVGVVCYAQSINPVWSMCWTHSLQVPVVFLRQRSCQRPMLVPFIDTRVVFIHSAIDVSQFASDCMKYRLRSTRVPLLASWTGKEICMCPSFNQQ